MENSLFIVLGNQLFPIDKHLSPFRQHAFFMAEDVELCTRYKIHKKKIILFLAAMRHYRDDLRRKKYRINYVTLDARKINSYETKLNSTIDSIGIQSIDMFEIEDKFFEKRIESFAATHNLTLRFHRSPGFLVTREQFKDHIRRMKRPLMKTFYEHERRRQKILMCGTKPIGGKYSFDEENRKKRPVNVAQPLMPVFQCSEHVDQVTEIVEKMFSEHPGRSDQFWPPVTRIQALNLLEEFVQSKIDQFGPYQDSIEDKNKFSFHSALSSSLNLGILTPDEVVARILRAYGERKIPLNSVEGFLRQIMGWREFVRGIYQNYSERQDAKNFFRHERKLTDHWYNGTTGITPLDDTIHFIRQHAYTNHIDRLMIIGNVMLLAEIHPTEAHRWFMELFIDGLDWVMGPNVYGMALYSDGGIFATKPYIAGSNYMLKMSHYKKGPWCEVVDGLYWRFVDKQKAYLVKNPRTSMMVKTFEKMSFERKQTIFAAAEKFLSEKTLK